MNKLLILPFLCLRLSGCSARTWFAGFVEGQKHYCNKLTGAEREYCLESIITDYDRYQRERQESLQRSD